MSGWAMAGQIASEIGGKLHDAYDRRKESDTEWHRQAQFAQQGIRWKVDDAKAAGIHPLYALGASTHSYQPQAVMSGGSWQDVGRSVGQAVQQQREASRLAEAESESRLAREAAERRAEEAHRSQLLNDEVQRTVAMSQVRLAGQPGNGPGVTLPTSNANLTGAGALKRGIEVVPDKVTAGKGGLTAGTHPGGTAVEIPIGKGRRMVVPTGAVSEALEDMELAKYALMIGMNRDAIGSFFMDDVPWAVRGYFDDLKKKFRPNMRRHGSGVRGP